jgi:hypothetical protein
MSLGSGDKTIARRARYEFTEALCISADITDGEFRVAFQLLTFMPARLDGQCYPAVETLSAGLHCSKRKVQTALRSLEAKGWFRRQPREGKIKTNRYAPVWDRAEEVLTANRRNRRSKTKLRGW